MGECLGLAARLWEMLAQRWMYLCHRGGDVKELGAELGV